MLRVVDDLRAPRRDDPRAPNVLGDALGVAQVLLYARYARAKPAEAAAADGGGLATGLLQ